MRNITVLLVSVLMAVATSIATSSPASSIDVSTIDNTVSEIGEKAFSEIGACLSPQEAQLNVLFVLDASSSLPEDTDKDQVRGAILAQSIAQLVRITESRPVNIAISSFDLDYKEQVSWKPLNQTSFKKIKEEIPSWMNEDSGWWGKGQGTDWEEALSGGAKTMRTSPKSITNCKIIIWLTDGGINVDGSRNIAKNKAAMEKICATNPVNGEPVIGDSIAAQLRSENVHLIGVLLKSEEYLDSLSNQTKPTLAEEQSRFSYMRPVTEGTGPVNNSAFVTSDAKELTYSCGNVPVPEGQASGALLPGGSPIALAFRFSDFANGIRGGTSEDLKSNFPVTFDIERGINSLTVQIAGSSWSLIGPQGPVVQSGAKSLDGISVSEEGDLANIRIEGAALPSGKWTLDVEEPLASAVIYRSIKVDHDFSINPVLKSGELSEITIGFSDATTDQPVPNDLYSMGDLEMRFTEGRSSPQDLDCVPDSNIVKFTCSVTPSQIGEAVINVSFILKTQSEQFLYTYNSSFVRDILADAKFPSITPNAVQLSGIAGKDGPATGTVTFNGPAQGSGEVCLPSEENLSVVSDVVDRKDSFSIEWLNVAETCVPLEQDESIDVQLSIGTSETASGQAILSLPFVLKSSDSANEIKQDVEATFFTVREGTPNAFVLLTLFIVGFGIPIALLYLQARSASRLSLKGLQWANIPVRLTITGDTVRLTRTTSSGSELFHVEDWIWFPSNVNKPRSFVTSSDAKLIARTPKNPLGSLSAFAVAPEGSRVITSEGSVTDGLRAKIGLSPANQWILTVPISELLSDQEELNGQLVAFANPNGAALVKVNRELSASAQDGMLLVSLLTVRSSLLADPEKGAPVKEKQAKKAKKSKMDPSTPKIQSAQESASMKEASPFDALLGDSGTSEGSSAQENSSSNNPSSPPPPKTPGSGMNNPFENL